MLRLLRTARPVYRMCASRPWYAPFSTQQKNLSESFIDGTGANYVEQMYERWSKDRSSVHASWDVYFQNVNAGVPSGQAAQAPPSLNWVRGQIPVTPQTTTAASTPSISQFQDSIRSTLLVRAYQTRGHTKAQLDPLNLNTLEPSRDLDAKTYGFTEADMEKMVFVGDGTQGGILSEPHWVKLKDLIATMERIYCGQIGFEYTHIQDHDQLKWVQDKIESFDLSKEITLDEKKEILKRLVEADTLEVFLATKYATTKRFGLDGCESLIPGMEALIDKASELGVEYVVIGMAHRGRINVMANVMNKPLAAVFHEFEGGNIADYEHDGFLGTGDVKYHLGTSTDFVTKHGRNMHLSLVANPSHLEAVDPVVEGKARAKQHYLKDLERQRVMSIQLHGDAAFAGQGVVYETLDLSGLNSYTTGGTIHIIVNNQIGFTTDPVNSRGPREHCTDVAKCNSAPIFHVNADNPEAVVYCMETAMEFRKKFKKDVVIDIVGYRRFGHNENDQPSYTQPLMYKKVSQQPRTLELYSKRLLAEGVITQDDLTAIKSKVIAELEDAHRKGKEYKVGKTEWIESRWKGFLSPQQTMRIRNTGVPIDILQRISSRLTALPQGFTVHRGIAKILEQKAETLRTGQKIDWATAEALAFGTLLLEGNHVRLSGQDVERGTFSQRHAIVHDQNTGEKYCFLNNLDTNQSEKLTVVNSSLSEFAVLGFELGYSMENPNSLVLWEAQFGDFANGAQIIFDQFLSSGEQKWMRQSGLVVLLPHGFEGQGPEHSSARLERFLQSSDSNPNVYQDNITTQERTHNWQVVVPSTPANYFHVLRRQIHRSFRKPLIVLEPKFYLKHPLATSSLLEFDDVGEDVRFQHVIPEIEPEALLPNNKITKLILCSGKVYYDLLQARRERAIKNVALVRVEQIAPFPFEKVREQGVLYPNAKVVWCQEEPFNAGAWSFINPHIRTALTNDRSRDVHYIGRGPSAAAATGSSKSHKIEVDRLLKQALEEP